MSETAIELRDVRKTFSLGFGVRRRVGLDGMSLSVRRGEIYGFLGPNGAGKTTSIKILTSLLRADAGHAAVFGLAPTDRRARARLGFLPESPVFYDHLTGHEFLRLAGRLAGLPRAETDRRANRLLERVGLAHAKNLQIRRYSKGMTQRVGIAQALIHDPELVILDEPMSGLDPMGRADVRDLILELHKEGKTIFFSTHIIPDVEVVCTRVGIVNKGRFLREGTVAELMHEGTSATVEVVADDLPADFRFEGAEEIVSGGRRALLAPERVSAQRLIDAIRAAGGTLVAVTPRRESLEDLVVKLLAKGEG